MEWKSKVMPDDAPELEGTLVGGILQRERDAAFTATVNNALINALANVNRLSQQHVDLHRRIRL